MLLLLPTLVYAELVFERGNDIHLNVPCFNNGALCSSSAYCNITTTYPNSSLLINNQVMINSVSYFSYNISGSFITENGDYENTIFCEDGDDKDFTTFSFLITSTGGVITTSESIIYFIFTGIVLLLFAFGLWLSIVIPFDNKIRNDGGAIIKLSYIKYIKLIVIMITYVLFVWFLNTLVGLSNNFVSLNLYFGFFSMLYMIFLYSMYIFELIMIMIFVYNTVKDNNMKEKIKKFGGLFE